MPKIDVLPQETWQKALDLLMRLAKGTFLYSCGPCKDFWFCKSPAMFDGVNLSPNHGKLYECKCHRHGGHPVLGCSAIPHRRWAWTERSPEDAAGILVKTPMKTQPHEEWCKGEWGCLDGTWIQKALTK